MVKNQGLIRLIRQPAILKFSLPSSKLFRSIKVTQVVDGSTTKTKVI